MCHLYELEIYHFHFKTSKTERKELIDYTHKLCPVWRITSGAIQYGVPFIDFAPVIVACSNVHDSSIQYIDGMIGYDPGEKTKEITRRKIRNDNRRNSAIPVQQLSLMHQSLQVLCTPYYQQGCWLPERSRPHNQICICNMYIYDACSMSTCVFVCVCARARVYLWREREREREM